MTPLAFGSLAWRRLCSLRAAPFFSFVRGNLPVPPQPLHTVIGHHEPGQ